jgi:putative transposase
MCLRFVFILVTRTVCWLRLSQREEAWKTAEILLLRHQLAVIPKVRRRGLRLLVTPDTIVRWHRDIVRHRWAAKSMRGKTGRPATRRNVRALVLRLARENPDRGYRRIHGGVVGLGVKVAAPTVREILRNAGIYPAERRTGPGWSQFLRSQAEAILACDFFTADLLDGTQAYVLAVLEHATRACGRRLISRGISITALWQAHRPQNTTALSWTCRRPAVDPALRRGLGRTVKYPCYQRIRQARVTLRRGVPGRGPTQPIAPYNAINYSVEVSLKEYRIPIHPGCR